MLSLTQNQICAEGAKHLASVLQVNTVRLHFSLYLTTDPLSFYDTDTHNAESYSKQNRR